MSLLIEGKDFAICLDSICGVYYYESLVVSNKHALSLLLKNVKEPFRINFEAKVSALKGLKEIRDALRQGNGIVINN